MQNPLISVIIVVLNGHETLERAITSVIDQTYKYYNLMIIDGGSDEKTIEIIKKYKNNISFWITEPDQGIYDAMNKGIAAAKGEWLYFLGCDDYLYDSHVLSSVADVIERCSCGILYGNVVVDGKKYDGKFSFDKLLRKNISHQSIFYNKTVFNRIGIFSLKYKTHADWEFNFRCFVSTDISIEYTDLIIAFFSKGGVSSSHDVPFLKEVIFPQRIKILNATGPKALKNLLVYDEWWRLIRNSRIANHSEFSTSRNSSAVPASIIRMINFQRRFSYKLLRNGFISKILMGFSYAINMIRG